MLLSESEVTEGCSLVEEYCQNSARGLRRYPTIMAQLAKITAKDVNKMYWRMHQVCDSLTSRTQEHSQHREKRDWNATVSYILQDHPRDALEVLEARIHSLFCVGYPTQHSILKSLCTAALQQS